MCNCRWNYIWKKYDNCKEGQFLLRLVNKDTPSVCNTSGFSQTACGFVVEFVDVVEKRSMNNTNTNAAGWFMRGGRGNATNTYKNAGIFDLDHYTGDAFSTISFRVVVR